MNAHLERAGLLFGQSRFELAEQELRQALTVDPASARAHSLLALCLAQREAYKEATTEAEQAIHHEPDSSFAHYALSWIWHQRNFNSEARRAINEAIRLDPEDADYYAELAAIEISERQWPAALAAAEQGLQFDSEHVKCTNLRAIALVKMGRKAEAGLTIDAALSRNPGNSLTHANQGWTLLEKGEPKKALEHFRESLRLDPDNEWARHGIVEALKARNIIYAMMLKYFLWMSRFSSKGQWGIILGAYFGNRLLGMISKQFPATEPWILPIRIVYVAFALMTWMAYPFFNLLLRMNKFGRLVLTEDQTRGSNWFGLCLALALIGLAGSLVRGFESIWVIVAMVPGFLLLPVSSIYMCSEGWPRKTIAGISIGLGVLGACTILAFWAADNQLAADRKGAISGAEALFTFFILGIVASTWISNYLRTRVPKK